MTATQRFVGRTAELALLRDHVGRSALGSGSVVLVRGPAGIGKTRLVEQALSGIDTVIGRGYAVDDPGAPPLWPWIQACSAAGMGDVVEALDSPPAATGSDEETAAARFRWLASVADRIAAATSSVVLVLEDVHWADKATLDLLRAVAASLAGAPVVIVATSRPADAEHETQYGLLERFPVVTSIDLPSLTVGEVAQLLGQDSAVAREVHADSHGVPLLLTAGRGSGYDIRRVALSLLAQAGDEQRSVAEAAAVLGEQVDRDLLAAVVDTAPDLDALARTGLLAPDGARFAHALVRDAVTDTVDGSKKAEIHRRAAAHLAERPGVGASRVATHLIAVGDRDAAAWARRAADEAAEALAYDDAARFLRVVEAAMVEAEVVDGLAETRLELATAHYLAGQPLVALELCRQVAASTERPELLAQAALVVRGMGFPDADRTNAELAEQALALEQPEATRSRLLSQLARAQANTNRTTEAAVTAGLAWECAQASGDLEALLDAAAARELTMFEPREEPERLEVALAATRYAEQLGRPVAAAIAQGSRMRAGYALVQLDHVVDAVESLTSLAVRTGLPLVEWHLARALTARSTMEGRFEEARASNDEARRLADAAGDIVGSSLSDALELQWALLRGRPEEITRREAMDDWPAIPLVLCKRALQAAAEGDALRLEASYGQLRPLLWQYETELRWGGVLLAMVDLVEVMGDAEAAEQLLTRIETGLELHGSMGIHTAFFSPPFSSLVGRCLVLLGRHQEAVPLLRRAVAECEALRARPYATHARVTLAGSLLATSTAAAVAEASGLLRVALDEARALGMGSMLARAHRLLEADHDPLSPREREIADLVVLALTNRDIAARLVISERTVETHVRAVLGKLGCANRTELIARRAELGL